MENKNPFNSVDTNTPTPFLNEITFDDFMTQTAAAPEAQPAPRPQSEATPPPNQFVQDPNGAPFNVGGQTNVVANQFINGKTAVAIVDIIIPLLLTYLLLTFVKKKVKRSQFQLTASEKSTLEPLLDACLATLNINFNNPWIALAVVGSTIYGAKFIEVASDESIPKIEVKKDAAGNAQMTTEKKKDGRGRPRKYPIKNAA